MIVVTNPSCSRHNGFISLVRFARRDTCAPAAPDEPFVQETGQPAETVAPVEEAEPTAAAVMTDEVVPTEVEAPLDEPVAIRKVVAHHRAQGPASDDSNNVDNSSGHKRQFCQRKQNRVKRFTLTFVFSCTKKP